MTLAKFDPPGFMTDFDNIPGQLEQWSNAISGGMDESIHSEKVLYTKSGLAENKVQFFNPIKTTHGKSHIDTPPI